MSLMECESCAYYLYDDEYEEQYCDIDMDEDDSVPSKLHILFPNVPQFHEPLHASASLLLLRFRASLI
jgi:hypothetical protein